VAVKYGVDLNDNQKAALKKLDNGKILWGGVGSGKSRVAVAYYETEHPHKDVYVITTAKKRDSKDWEGEFAQIAVCPWSAENLELDLKPPYGWLIVDSWNNIDKYRDVKDAFFIFDEQRLVGSGTWVKAFLRIAKHNKWIMLSATPGDNWMDYIPVFLANGFYRSRREFKLQHVVYAPFVKFPKVERYTNVNYLSKLRNQILVHMRYDKQTIRHSMIRNVRHNEELVQHVIKNRWHIFADRPIRDITELFSVLRRIVNSDPSRIRKVEELLTQHPKIVLFYNFNYELDILRRLGDQLPIAEWNGHKHEPIPSGDSWLYLVQYVAGSEAWECTETDTIVFYSLTYSYKLWEQAHGRIDRLNTPFTDLYYYILRSRSGMDMGIWRSLTNKKNFNVNHYPIESLKEVGMPGESSTRYPKESEWLIDGKRPER
jgi:hypothetical protein